MYIYIYIYINFKAINNVLDAKMVLKTYIQKSEACSISLFVKANVEVMGKLVELKLKQHLEKPSLKTSLCSKVP